MKRLTIGQELLFKRPEGWSIKMYAVDLICSNGHRFEGWFSNRGAFVCQKHKNMISCTMCGDTSVQQVMSAARIRKHGDQEKPKRDKPKKPTVAEILDKYFENVGERFANEAIRMHIGESEKRNIRGTATSEEEQTLADEGIPFFKIPEFQ